MMLAEGEVRNEDRLAELGYDHDHWIVAGTVVWRISRRHYY